MNTEHHLNGRHPPGKREMHELALSAFTALEESDLPELLHTLHARVFDRAPQDVLDVELVDGVWEWKFKPMIELLLRHIVVTSGTPTMSMAERENEIKWAVEMMGS